ncbi:MAG: hypothetical protein ACOX6T_19290 [Myxococcales bacterium]
MPLLLSGTVLAAEPDEDPWPVRNIDRPPVLPPSFSRLDALVTTAHGPDNSLRLSADFGYGLLKQLELGALFFDLQLAPRVAVGNPAVYGLYLLDLLPALAFIPYGRLALPLTEPFAFELGAAFELRLADAFEIAAQPSYLHRFGSEPLTVLSLPFTFKLQLARRLAFTPLFGATLSRDGDDSPAEQTRLLVFDSGAAVLGFELGMTTGERPGLLAELVLLWQWPALVVVTGSDARFNPGEWSLSVGARLFAGPRGETRSRGR